jgi:hypothetical protein
MEKTVKATAKQTKKNVEAAANELNKITTTAKSINTQVMEVAEELVEDVVNSAKEVRAVATKSVKEVAEKVDFTDSIEKAKSAAKNINTQIKEATTDLVEDLKENTEDLRKKATKMAKNTIKQVETNVKEARKTATKLAKEAIENVNLTERVNNLKKVAADTNAYALQTADELVDGLTVSTEKWQGVAEKAMKNGMKLAARQQDIMFATLEAAKTQIDGSVKRFKKLVNANKNEAKA